MEILRNFAVLEGPDGSGTTTQLNTLDSFFHPQISEREALFVAESSNSYFPTTGTRLPTLYKTFEPTSGIIGKLIRQGLGKEANLSPETIAYLFAADRNEHIHGPDGVAERCKRGELVVSDRYLLSSLVYQGITCGEELPFRLNRDFPSPELLIYLDIEPEIAQKRISKRENLEIYENLSFQNKVRERYKTLLPLFEREGIIVEIIDASTPPMDVAVKVWSAIQKMSIFKG